MKRIDKLWKNTRDFFVGYKKDPMSAKKIAFSYDGNEILKDLNLTVKTSQIVAVVGRSGSGKSTFLNIIAGVVTSPYKGRIKIMGHFKEFAKQDIGYVPQEISVVPHLTIEENLIFSGSINGLSPSKALAEGKNLMDVLQLEIPLTRHPYELSGGQRVRLNIIVSLLHNPKLVILDEPFVGLDYYNRKLLWHFLEHLKNRRNTIILTSHMLTETEHFTDRIVLLHKGKVFAKGKMKDIRNKLKTHYILELKFREMRKKHLDGLKRYCRTRNITILDSFKNYMMFSITTAGQRNYLLRFLEKQNIDYAEKSFRQPNLDELFLRVRSA